ncbi:hypothetical protein Poly41_03720 [Novipirellula artificiosorum]|uniref:Uncharacterized protein n=1 Tax=Novipirellula artificiosorum TaxID=2528016 RepID=A0A5C6E3R1_9BACT|nr:hypothetical protein Poly41_03720 [Novipirellula artificiosorum]
MQSEGIRLGFCKSDTAAVDPRLWSPAVNTDSFCEVRLHGVWVPVNRITATITRGGTCDQPLDNREHRFVPSFYGQRLDDRGRSREIYRTKPVPPEKPSPRREKGRTTENTEKAQSICSVFLCASVPLCFNCPRNPLPERTSMFTKSDKGAAVSLFDLKMD